jgi:hypothetical protein
VSAVADAGVDVELVAELEALLAASRATRAELAELLTVVVDELRATDELEQHR